MRTCLATSLQTRVRISNLCHLSNFYSLLSSVLVRLFENMKETSYAKEIWLTARPGKIDIDGSRGKYMVSLSQVLPEVFANHSPIKGTYTGTYISPKFLCIFF